MRAPLRSKAAVGTAALALVFSAASGQAQPARHSLTEASKAHDVLTRAAEIAFATGHYGFAIQAWLRAFAHAGHAPLLLDVARAHHRRFERDGDPRDRIDAMTTYRHYLGATPPRDTDRGRAERALRELEEATGDDDGTPAEPRRAVTRLGVLCNMLAAEVSIDGGAFQPAPRFVVVSPGRHRIAVRAPSHLRAEREVRVSRGGIAALDVQLEPEPAELVIRGAEDTAVHIDGQRVALPDDEDDPLTLAPGEHLVAVTQTGFHPYARTVDLERGKRQTVDVELTATGQRAAAISLLTAGGLALTTGIVLGAFAVDADRNSRTGAARDFRAASGIVGISGVAVLVTGGTLLILDEPDVPTAPTLSLFPTLGPHGIGAGVISRF